MNKNKWGKSLRVELKNGDVYYFTNVLYFVVHPDILEPLIEDQHGYEDRLTRRQIIHYIKCDDNKNMWKWLNKNIDFEYKYTLKFKSKVMKITYNNRIYYEWND